MCRTVLGDDAYRSSKVDISDFLIAYCPTNIYSVGTPHEIVVARQQHKPVLFVSPPVAHPALAKLKGHLTDTGDETGQALLEELLSEVPIKANSRGIPSLWYMPLIGGEKFFDGFGFDQYRDRFDWEIGPLDQREQQHPPKRPLLAFLEEINTRLPEKWSLSRDGFVQDDDWLLLDFDRS